MEMGWSLALSMMRVYIRGVYICINKWQDSGQDFRSALKINVISVFCFLFLSFFEVISLFQCQRTWMWESKTERDRDRGQGGASKPRLKLCWWPRSAGTFLWVFFFHTEWTHANAHVSACSGKGGSDTLIGKEFNVHAIVERPICLHSIINIS